MKTTESFKAIILFITLSACATLSADATNEIVLFSDVNWEPLNPARGKSSPIAGTLWGDRMSQVPTGFLVKFVDGFSSPPHIHNITYRGVVISGHIHNDDPKAEAMWMGPVSFWTQPIGEPHITAAKGKNTIAYIEIDRGPYLVLPTEEAFDNGERPINIDKSNLVWMDLASNGNNKDHAKISYLWGTPSDGQTYGALIKLPAGLSTKMLNDGTVFHAVIIKGSINYSLDDETKKQLVPGSYFNANGMSTHTIQSEEATESVIYVRTNGTLKINP